MVKLSAPTVPWNSRYRLFVWLSFGIYFIAFVLFMVAYVGTSWYVVPNQEYSVYPPASGQTEDPLDQASLDAPLTFGLFYMCYYGHCKYDLRMDYYIVQLLPQELGVTLAYQKFRTVCMAIITIAMIVSILILGSYMLYLSRVSYGEFVGFLVGGCQIGAGVIAMIGVIIFGVEFRGKSETLPFGWSFWLMVVSLILFIVNGALTILLAVLVVQSISRPASQGRVIGRSQ